MVSLCSLALTLGVCVWVSLAFARLRWSRRTNSTTTPCPTVSAVIPARNEALDLETTIRSLLIQENVSPTIVVVNDHSTDATPQILSRLAAGEPRVVAIHDPPLRPHWLGKVNAMQTGLEQAQGDLVLFTDADIFFDPRTLAIAVAELMQRNLDFLSLLPRVESETCWEHALLPAYYLGAAQLAGPGLRNPSSPRALAAGAFMLVRRKVLEEIGGLELLRDQALDDVAFARLLKSRGYSIDVFAAPDLISVRLFKSNHDAFWGLTKNALAMVDNRLWTVPPMLLANAIGVWLPLICLLTAALMKDFTAFLFSLLAVTAQFLLAQHCRWLFNFRGVRLACALAEPLPITCCYLRAIDHRVRRGGVFWRGRVIKTQ